MTTFDIMLFKLVIVISLINNICSRSDCDVCKGFRKCVDLCKTKFDNSITSDLSLKHCGISYFSNKLDKRILNGQVAPEGEFPWMVSILKDELPWENRRSHICGGAIISSRFILTAAHCADGFDSDMLWIMMRSNSLLGDDKNALVIGVDKIIMHKDYNDHNKENDIALLKTTRDIIFEVNENSFKINSICLPRLNYRATGIATMTGWGRIALSGHTTTNLLRMAYCSIIDDKDTCTRIFMQSKAYKKGTDEWTINPIELKDTQLCFMASIPPFNRVYKYSQTTAPGDSGSGYFKYINNRAHSLGIHSFVSSEIHNTPTTVATKVSMYINWIKENIK